MSGVTILNTMEHTRWAWGWTQWSWIALGAIVAALITLWCITGYRRYLKGLGETMPKFFSPHIRQPLCLSPGRQANG